MYSYRQNVDEQLEEKINQKDSKKIVMMKLKS